MRHRTTISGKGTSEVLRVAQVNCAHRSALRKDSALSRMKYERVVLGLVCMLGAATASAHVPHIEHSDSSPARPRSLEHEMERSIAVYSYFQSRSDLDVVAFTLNEDDFDPSLTMHGVAFDAILGRDYPLVVTDENGVTGRSLYFGTLVPYCSVYSGLLPRVALVGPEQENLPAYRGPEPLPFPVAPGQGVYLLDNPEQGDKWYEVFTMKNYYQQASTEVVLTEPGEYRLYFWEPAGGVGDYVAAIGDIEVWGAPEIRQALWYEMMLLHDGEIHSAACRAEL